MTDSLFFSANGKIFLFFLAKYVKAKLSPAKVEDFKEVIVASEAATPAPDPLASPTPLVVVVETLVGGGAIGG